MPRRDQSEIVSARCHHGAAHDLCEDGHVRSAKTLIAAPRLLSQKQKCFKFVPEDRVCRECILGNRIDIGVVSEAMVSAFPAVVCRKVR